MTQKYLRVISHSVNHIKRRKKMDIYNLGRMVQMEQKQMAHSEYRGRVVAPKSEKWTHPVLAVRAILTTLLHLVTKLHVVTPNGEQKSPIVRDLYVVKGTKS